MSEKDNPSNSNIEDKDFGFPFVEVTPLQSVAVPGQNKKNENSEEIVFVPETSETISSGKANPETSSIRIKLEKKTISRKKSQLPLLMSLVFLIIIILGALAYFLYYIPESASSLEEVAIPSPSETSTEVESITEDIEDLYAENDEAEEADNIIETNDEIPVSTQAPETTNVEITVVDKRGEIPYFNVIVASSPNERIARTEAQKYIAKGISVWIIFPFGNTNNYRISVGRYEDIETATKAMETAKAELNESSWILKY